MHMHNYGIICCCLSLDPIQLHISSPVVSFSTVQISFNSSAPTQCKMDNLDFSPCQSPYQMINLKPGEHTITIKATDNGGCVKENSATFYIAGIVSHFILCVVIYVSTFQSQHHQRLHYYQLDAMSKTTVYQLTSLYLNLALHSVPLTTHHGLNVSICMLYCTQLVYSL